MRRINTFSNVFLLDRTKGGAGGTVTTVSTLPQFTEAVKEKNSEPVVVFVKGVISGSAKVRIGSNKSIIGLPGSGKLSHPGALEAMTDTSLRLFRLQGYWPPLQGPEQPHRAQHCLFVC